MFTRKRVEERMDGQTPYLWTRCSLIKPLVNGGVHDTSLTSHDLKSNEICFTLISPSPAPLTKNSSCGSSARHLIADSCAWNLCLCCRCRTSNILMSPFLPPLINSWCCGARINALAPWSWHMKPDEKLRVVITGKISESHYLLVNEIILSIWYAPIIRTLYKRFVLWK